jgi:Na+/H+ antiporter NhaD/arsenite permease-like protein
VRWATRPEHDQQDHDEGSRISFWDFARTGIPITLASMLLAAGWLWLMQP